VHIQSKSASEKRVTPSHLTQAYTTPRELFLLYRRRSGWSQSELGARLGGINGRTVRNWESDCNLPKPATLYKLLTVYLEAGIFLPGEEHMEARSLWQEVKARFDNSTERLEVYPAFDDEAFLAQLRQRADGDSFPPSSPRLAASLTPIPGNLPPLPPHLLERRQETQSILDALTDTRLLTLTGPGGVGKTTLQLLVAHAVQTQFPDGVYLIELTSLTGGDAPLSATARTLGIGEEADRALIHTVCTFLRPRRALLLLDNIEHLLDGAAALSTEIVRSCPSVTILSSGREAMRLRDEREWRVPSLKTPDEVTEWNVDEFPKIESVALFLQRARSIGAEISLDEGNASAIAHICRQLDGIPLAIELAAARTPVFGLRSLSQQMDKDFQFLSAGYRDSPQRHQAMRASIQWSYDLTTDQEQKLWQRLSVFTGGLTLSAAEAVCGDSEPVADILAGLVNKSLIQVDEMGKAARYRFLETIRHFGEEKRLMNDHKGSEEKLLRGRHLAYFTAFVARVATDLHGTEATESVRQIQSEYANLRSTLEWSARTGADQESVRNGIELALSLREFWFTSNYVTEARSQVSALLKAGRDAGFGKKLAFDRLLSLAGILAQAQNDYAATHLFLTEAVAGFEASENWEDAGIALRCLLHACMEQGEYTLGESYFERIRYVMERHYDPVTLSFGLALGGVIAGFRGDLTTGLARIDEGLDLARRLGMKLNINRLLNGQAILAIYQERYAEAENMLLEADSLLNRTQYQRPAAHVTHLMGITMSARGDSSAALRYQQESIILCRRVGLKIGFAWTLTTVADWLMTFGSRKDTYAPVKAAMLCGAVSHLLKEMNSRLPPVQQLLFDRSMKSAREFLSEREFSSAFANGQVMSLESAVTLALSLSA